MNKRWMMIISDSDGLDAVIQLADDQEAGKKLLKTIDKIDKNPENVEKRIKIIHALDFGRILTDSYQIRNLIKDYIDNLKSIETEKITGRKSIGEYFAYDMRKRYANGNLLEVSIIATEDEMNKMRRQNPYKAAIDVLNIVLTGRGKTASKRDTNEDVQDYIDIMEMKLKKAKRKGYV